MAQIAPKIIRQIFILLLILLLGSLIFREMLPYLSGVLGAVTFHILLRKLMAKLVNNYKWKPWVAAIVLMIASFFIILIPITGIVLMLGNKVSEAAKNSEKVINAIKQQISTIEDNFGLDINASIDTQSVTNWITDNVQSMAGGTFNAFIAVSLMYFMLYFMLTHRRELRHSIREYLPMNLKSINQIGDEVQAMVKANAIGIPVVALAQGIIALIGFLIFGVEDPFFWFVIVTIGSMIPFVGTALGIIPVFILSLSKGDSFQAWGILIYGASIVGATDNIIRLYVLKKLDDVHPLVTLIGVIVGVPIFGFIGLIFGPLLISLFMGLARIYKQEYGKQAFNKSDERL